MSSASIKMNTQQGKIQGGNATYCHPIQFTGGTNNVTSSNLSGPSQVSVSSGNLPGSISGSSVPLQLTGASINHPLINRPLQLPPSTNIQLAHPTVNVPVQLNTSSGQPNLPMIQLQLGNNANQKATRMVAQSPYPAEKTTDVRGASAEITSIQLQVSDHMNASVPVKIQAPSTNLAVVGTPMQLQMASSNGSGSVQLQIPVPSNPIQIRANPRIVPPLMYIQTSSGLKAVTSADMANSNCVVKRPVTSGAVQFVSTQNTKPLITTKPISVNKTTPLAPLPQSIVIQKPKQSITNIGPVSISTTTDGKHTFACVKKPISITSSKPQEGQSLLVTSHLPIQAPNNTKYVLASMNNKTQKAKFLFPTTKGPIFNLQIANGQIQNDTQGSITVMRESSSMHNTEMPPLTPLSKPPAAPSALPDPPVSQSTTISDKSFLTSIPGSRAELIGEQEYTLSIPDTSVSLSDDVYTVSISDEAENAASETAFTISLAEKGKSLLCKNQSDFPGQDIQCTSSNIPAILRRSNSDSLDKKFNSQIRRRVSLSGDPLTEKLSRSEVSIEKIPNSGVSIMTKSKMSEINEENEIPSLFCDEKLENDLNEKVTSKIVHDNVEESSANNGFVPQPPIIKDRRKSRISIDYKNCESGDAKSFNRSKDGYEDVVYEDDTPGLQWNNRIGVLDGSALQFRTNEFGIIDLVDADEFSHKSKYYTPINQRINRNGRDKKPTSPEDLYCCDECGCHGMAADFVTPNFCSHLCQVNYNNHKRPQLRKDRDALELKKKRKPKKALIMKPKEKEIDKEEEVKKTPIIPKWSDELAKISMIENKSLEDGKSKYPWMLSELGFSWNKYLNHCKAISAPSKLFKEPLTTYKNGFKIGMKLEAIDPVHPALYAAVTVTRIQGYRIKLHFDSYHEDFDFWVNADSSDIFPTGWCEKNGRVLRPPMGFTKTSFSWNLYLKQAKAISAPRHLFPHISSTNICPSSFRIGMKLEAEDRKNSLTCVATVADVMDNRVLIHFDSWDDIYDYWVDPSSPYIHPVGWCDENGYSLTPPNIFKDPEHFTWDKYLAETNSMAVPARAFKPRPPHNFKIGMKLEAVDKRVPFLIRVATLTDTRCHQIRISFDGWPDALSYWVDDDSPDIHPAGWCLKTEHALEPPLTPEDLEVFGACGTAGCHGLGNLQGAKQTTHSTAADCPYRLPVVSPALRDRLAGARPPPMHTEPRPKEPRRIGYCGRGRPPKVDSRNSSTNGVSQEPQKERTSVRGRPPKNRKPEEEIKSETMNSDDDSNSFQAKKKRMGSPITQIKVENSVLEPGYMPNASWAAPPRWTTRCLPLDSIIESQGLRADPRNWSQAEVQDFVEKVSENTEFSWQFSKHHIDGESFLMLSQEDLVSVLGIRLGPAIKIYNSIIQLRQRILS